MSSRISFRIAPHRYIPDTEVVEILLNGAMCATIYPDQYDQEAIKLVSAHFAGELTRNNQFPAGITMDTAERRFPPVPAIKISFDVRRYTMDEGTIVRLE